MVWKSDGVGGVAVVKWWKKKVVARRKGGHKARYSRRQFLDIFYTLTPADPERPRNHHGTQNIHT
jgi:hypothetical protein